MEKYSKNVFYKPLCYYPRPNQVVEPTNHGDFILAAFYRAFLVLQDAQKICCFLVHETPVKGH